MLNRGLFSDSEGPVPPPRRKDGGKTPEPPKSMYEKLPDSLKTELLVRTVEGDVDEKTLAQRQELTRSKSPAQLGQIHGLSDDEKVKTSEEVVNSLAV